MKRVLQLVSVIALAAAPACVVRGSGTVGVDGTTTVYSEPPPPQVETVGVRPGFVWVRGHYVWMNGQWTWTAGHWERQRAGYAWTEGRWEHRSNACAQGGGSVTVGAYPTAAPPPPQGESIQPRAGFVWITGRWDWHNGRWEWMAGHWERERAIQMWVAGRWELQGGRYVWVEGSWQARAATPPAGPIIRDHRH